MECLNELDKRAFEFFKKFSQAEFALKNVPKFRKIGIGGKAEANWNAFFKDQSVVSVIQNARDDLKEARDYILANPPQKLIIRSNRLVWDDVPSTTNTNNDLNLSLRCIRNNLFHGGKSVQSGGFEDNQRNKDLLRHGIRILDACLMACTCTQQYYDF